jgi:hypothetical protein
MEIEKGNLEKKFASQSEEFKEKKMFFEKVKKKLIEC